MQRSTPRYRIKKSAGVPSRVAEASAHQAALATAALLSSNVTVYAYKNDRKNKSIIITS